MVQDRTKVLEKPVGRYRNSSTLESHKTVAVHVGAVLGRSAARLVIYLQALLAPLRVIDSEAPFKCLLMLFSGRLIKLPIDQTRLFI